MLIALLCALAPIPQAEDDAWVVDADHGPSRLFEYEATEGTWISLDVSREIVLASNEVLADITVPAAPGLRSTYAKVLDREAWTHAVVSVAVFRLV